MFKLSGLQGHPEFSTIVTVIFIKLLSALKNKFNKKKNPALVKGIDLRPKP